MHRLGVTIKCVILKGHLYIMIKVTELMINDWVSINDSNYKVKNIKKKGVIKLYEDTQWGEHEIDFNTDSLEDVLQPIPLTEEILEKNGYKRGLLIREYKISDGLHYDLEGGLLLFGHEYGTVLEIKCNYVHEFQHLLKLCKIEKEIVL